MRTNGTRTPREQANELARIDEKLNGMRAALSLMTARLNDGHVPEHVGRMWNNQRDAVTALEAERARVELNAPYADATGLLIAQNID